nr:chorion peroxidase [Leptinotarsa decemlineata]
MIQIHLVSSIQYQQPLEYIVNSRATGECALILEGQGRSSQFDYSLNLLRGNNPLGYNGPQTCITYDAINAAYLDARKRIRIAQPHGEWKPEDVATVGELLLDISINLARTLLGPLFSDGMVGPRIGISGRALPPSRVVSRTMHPDDGYHDHAGTVMIIAWGQFMDHDYTLQATPLDPINRNDPEECCGRPPHLKHPYCNEIYIPEDDLFYKLFHVKCIDFVRTFPGVRPGCRLGSKVPYNTLTGVIDGNTVYGVKESFARKLRSGIGGLLRMNPAFDQYGLKDLLPLKLDVPDEGCTRPNSSMYCFEGGEIRVNEQLVLTCMHTLMAREHNRLAKGLAEVNPHWDDETLYQEARRINIAIIQHITYNEFLPILLGKGVMEKFGLLLQKEGYWDGYDPNVNPGVIDAFAAAAFRFGHSLLPTAIERWSKAHKFIGMHPNDVDLWSGGVSEKPLPASMLGPTFACIIATQFSYSRRGDRFWYELPNQPSSFTPEQLQEVRKARLARIICDNTDLIDTIQLYPMVLPDHEINPRVPCRSGVIPGIDLSKWAEFPPHPIEFEHFLKK